MPQFRSAATTAPFIPRARLRRSYARPLTCYATAFSAETCWRSLRCTARHASAMTSTQRTCGIPTTRCSSSRATSATHALTATDGISSGGEPRKRAALRGRELTVDLHGTKAVYGWLGPGDYLDFLDDIAAEMS